MRVAQWLLSLSIGAVALCAVTALGPTAAKADITFNLDTANSSISGFTGPYASVDVHLIDSTHATITFTGLTTSSDQYLMGGQGTVGVNVNGSFTVSNITQTQLAGFNPQSNSGTPFNVTSGNEDGFGSFNLSIDSFDGFTYSSLTFSFELTNTSGTPWTESSVLIANSQDAEAAAHIFVCENTTATCTTASNNTTGFAAGQGTFIGPPPFTIPEPSTLALFGTALLGLGLIGRSRRRS